MPVRKLFFWLHLTAALTAGLVIFTMSVTGVLLAFERQILAAAERNLRTDADAARAPLPISSLVNAAGARASSVTLRSDRHAPVTVALGREKTIFVHRYTGQILGEGAVGLRRFFHVVEDVHRWLALEGDARERGKAVTAAANAIFLFILLSGLYIWIPRRRAALSGVIWFRGGLRGKQRDFNWHNALGIWSFLPLVLIVFSGVVISYRLFGGAAPQQQQQQRSKGSLDVAVLDGLFEEAARVAPRWQSMSVRLPIADRGPVTISIDEGNGARPDKRSQLLFDAQTLRVIEHKTYTSQKPGQKTRAWLRWIHTGEAGGLPGQMVAVFASAAAVVLVWTGLALALRRFLGWKNRKELTS